MFFLGIDQHARQLTISDLDILRSTLRSMKQFCFYRGGGDETLVKSCLISMHNFYAATLVSISFRSHHTNPEITEDSIIARAQTDLGSESGDAESVESPAVFAPK